MVIRFDLLSNLHDQKGYDNYFVISEIRFDLLSNLHDQKEYDNYFIISRETVMLATLNNKN